MPKKIRENSLRRTKSVFLHIRYLCILQNTPDSLIKYDSYDMRVCTSWFMSLPDMHLRYSPFKIFFFWLLQFSITMFIKKFSITITLKGITDKCYAKSGFYFYFGKLSCIPSLILAWILILGQLSRCLVVLSDSSIGGRWYTCWVNEKG